MKRRFAKAMLELGNSQASCTARRLVGQTIRAVEKRRAAQHQPIGLLAPPPPPNQKIQQQQRRQFRYTFAPANHAGQQPNGPSGEFLAVGGRQSSLGERRLESGRQDHGRARQTLMQTQTRQRQAKASASRPGKFEIESMSSVFFRLHLVKFSVRWGKKKNQRKKKVLLQRDVRRRRRRHYRSESDLGLLLVVRLTHTRGHLKTRAAIDGRISAPIAIDGLEAANMLLLPLLLLSAGSQFGRREAGQPAE